MNRNTKIGIGVAVAALVAVPGVAVAVHALDGPPTTRAGVIAEVKERFAEMDEDKDGKLLVPRREMAPPPADAAARFASLDADRNGQLSPQEFAAAPDRGPDAPDGPDGPRGHRGPRGDHDGHRGGPLVEADANHDGAVTLAELQASALGRFDAADVNRDGKLSEEERRAAGPGRGPKG